MSLYKFTHTPLLKIDSQLKQKSDKPKKLTELDKLHMGIKLPHFLPSVLSILRRKLFGKSREKTPEPYYLFSFLPTQPNTL